IFRRYALTYFWYWLLVFVFVALPFFFMFVLFSWGYWGIGLFSASLIFAFFVLFRTLFFWRTNVFIVTNQRVVRIEQKGVLNKIVTDLNFYNIRSISYKIKGVFPTIFRYGKIIIETNDAKGVTEINRIHKPAEAVDIMAQIQQKQMQENNNHINLESILSLIKNETKENLLKLKETVDKRLKELL
ncbi:MAG: PH domain-containing protein, partial [Candidatus Magasanikbacteria bacterium]|nr:PH domain-containing protein [Candidatus Magasanikbacteria bacterium]